MAHRRRRDTIISVFVVVWILAFHYESMRYFFLQPFFDRPLPKIKFLFPPAGWIMFFNVGDQHGVVEVFGLRGGVRERLDPHDILQTRTIGYDNIHRNVLGQVLNPALQGSFCVFLKRKFPEYDAFEVAEIFYPSLTRSPRLKIEEVVARCPP